MQDIATPFYAHRLMSAEWQLVADLMGGTRTMRQAGLRWLPREAAESWSAWRSRLNRTFLFNAFARTVHTLSGLPFSQPLRIDNLHPQLAGLTDNFDGQGTNIHNFATQLLSALLQDGIVHIQLDRPQSGGALYGVIRRASSLIYAAQNTDHTLQEIRFSESAAGIENSGYDQPCEQIRQLTPTHWAIYQRAAKSQHKWHCVAQAEHDFGSVPVITISAYPTGWMQSRLPLIDLAWLNLAHWQSSSDQRHILHVARVPVLFGRALQVEQQDIEIGPNRLILADDPAAELKFVEHSGAAIEAGRQDLIDLEDRMALMGFDMLSRSTTPVTATARQLDSMQHHAALSSLVSHIEQGLQQALCLAAKAGGLSEPDGGVVCADRCWQQQSSLANKMEQLRHARLSGQMSKSEFIEKAGHVGLLADPSVS